MTNSNPNSDIFDSNSLTTNSTMTVTKFEVASGYRAKKKSLQLKIAGTAEADFELQDMSIIFRSRGVR